MLYEVRIRGFEPGIIMHSSRGLDTRLPENLEKKEITSKKGSNRTEADDARLRELEVRLSLWLNEKSEATIPTAAFRSCIEKAARKKKQGPQVREGLVVARTLSFDYDRENMGVTVEELASTAQFTVPVVVGRSRLLRTRALFPTWEASFEIDTDEELVDRKQLESWISVAGRRVGLGDWRPDKSGSYGRFELLSIEEQE